AIRLIGDYPHPKPTNRDGGFYSLIDNETLGPTIGVAQGRTTRRRFDFLLRHADIFGPKRIAIDFGEVEISTDQFLMLNEIGIRELDSYVKRLVA
ncbi:MAG: hypothetical protein KDE05_08570, partial [Parvularculaceae bacterium]|nr:hypothetical protein [Parvularculaceae bacterium]